MPEIEPVPSGEPFRLFMRFFSDQPLDMAFLGSPHESTSDLPVSSSLSLSSLGDSRGSCIHPIRGGCLVHAIFPDHPLDTAFFVVNAKSSVISLNRSTTHLHWESDQVIFVRGALYAFSTGTTNVRKNEVWLHVRVNTFICTVLCSRRLSTCICVNRCFLILQITKNGPFKMMPCIHYDAAPVLVYHNEHLKSIFIIQQSSQAVETIVADFAIDRKQA